MTADEIKKEIQRLQNELKKVEKEPKIKRPIGKLTYFIYSEENGEHKCKDETEWVKKLFGKVKKSYYLYVQYYIRFDKDKNEFDWFIKEWKNPTENDIHDFLNAVYSAENYLQIDSMEIGIADKKDCMLYQAYFKIPSFEELKKRMQIAKKNKDNSFFDILNNWKLEYK